MSDPRTKLQAMFKEENRYANFGSALAQMHIQGFRCHSSTPVELQSPITALCGLNGTGKSTILQLAAAAYRPPSGAKRFYVRDFIVAGKLDTPFTLDASVRYQYLRDESKLRMRIRRRQVVTVSRSPSKWTGYKRQPIRHVFFQEWAYIFRAWNNVILLLGTPRRSQLTIPCRLHQSQKRPFVRFSAAVMTKSMKTVFHTRIVREKSSQ